MDGRRGSGYALILCLFAALGLCPAAALPGANGQKDLRHLLRLEFNGDAVMDGRDFSSAAPRLEELVGQMQVVLTCTDEGAVKLAKVTSEHVGEHIEIMLGKRLLMSARIVEAITSGKVCISGIDPELAEDLEKLFKP